MDNLYWTMFEKTGNIYDYLNYTVCTSEDACGNHVVMEGGSDGSTNYSDRHGSVSHGDWRL